MLPSENEIRREKLQAIQDAGLNPYPSISQRTATCIEALQNFDAWQKKRKKITLAGRVMTTRVHGGLIFADLQDSSGCLQILLKLDDIGDENFALFRDRIDPADFIEATGSLFETKKGEKTLQVKSWKILCKALLPLPEKWHGLQDQELRYRFRELDLISNPEVREVFHKRSKIVKALRHALEDEGFEEVETPILQSVAGGATAKPFTTHHNALDIELYLRIAPEIYLKRLIVGGYEKVFEIGRQFRNEGVDWSHNPEFTSCEFYWAYQDYHGLMKFTEDLLSRVIKEVNGGSLKVRYGEHEIDFTAPWPRIDFRQGILDATGIDIEKIKREELVKKMKKAGIEADYTAGLGKLFDELYKDAIRNKQIGPVFVVDYPIEMEPLAKPCEGRPKFVQRFQLLAASLELLKAYSELNDPIDQMERFEAQQALRAKGDEEAQQIDYSFIKSLEHGLPPTAGWGMGIDRFVTLLANIHSVKDVILFPTMRPLSGNDQAAESDKK
ncbi:lysine--tRNA ligase [Patescibacteria group bacterium]|nr:lysine--tRNA ligase [Patescibacteria group bacterium]